VSPIWDSMGAEDQCVVEHVEGCRQMEEYKNCAPVTIDSSEEVILHSDHIYCARQSNFIQLNNIIKHVKIILSIPKKMYLCIAKQFSL
jgi:hypothetical protein